MSTPSHAPNPVRIPANVEREDRVLAQLTARQLAILTVTGLLLYGAYAASRAVVPLVVFAVVAVPVAVAAAVIAVGSRDGLSLDRLLVAAVRQRLTPRLQIAAPGGIAPAPGWLTAHAVTLDDDNNNDAAAGRGGPVSPGALDLPARAVTEAGMIDLGPDGLAAVCVTSTVNFVLQTPGEQEMLVASFGRYLHSLSAPVQILIRAQRLDLTGQIAELRERAGGLPHPALEQAARDHADYLTHLAGQSELLRRQVLLVLREPVHSPAIATAAGLLARGARRTGRGRRAGRETGGAARRAAETRLARRIGEAISLLAAAGIVVTPLDAGQVTAVLAGACNPDTLIAPSAGLAAAEEVITLYTTTDDDTDTYATNYPNDYAAGYGGRDSSDDPASPPAEWADDGADSGGDGGSDDGADEMWWAR